MERKTQFRNVSLPTELVEKIERHVGKYGYRSIADVVVDAVRRHLDYLESKENLSEVVDV